MDWGVDDDPITVAPGQTKSEDLGKQFGEVLGVFSGGHITKFKITAAASHDPSYTGDQGMPDCPLRVRKLG